MILRYTLLAIGCFFAGFTAAAGYHFRDDINALVYASSQDRQNLLAGEYGPVTYLVFNDDFNQLKQFADSDAEILGVEQALNSNVAKVAFTSAKSPSIEALATLPFVSEMIHRDVPMICH